MKWRTHVKSPHFCLEEYKKSCFVFWEIFTSPWPKNLTCSSLPDVNDTSVCIGYKEAHEPPVVKGIYFV
jgi:hypothetical protein